MCRSQSSCWASTSHEPLLTELALFHRSCLIVSFGTDGQDHNEENTHFNATRGQIGSRRTNLTCAHAGASLPGLQDSGEEQLLEITARAWQNSSIRSSACLVPKGITILENEDSTLAISDCIVLQPITERSEVLNQVTGAYYL